MLCGKSIADVYTTSCIATADKIIPEKPTNWKGVREERRRRRSRRRRRKRRRRAVLGG